MRIPPAVLVASMMLAGAAGAEETREILGARYDAPTDRYGHGVLGDAIEWGALVMQVDTCPACALLKTTDVTFTLPQARVFEDLEPRLADVDLDGDNEVIVIETNRSQGASLAIYDDTGKIAQTPYIGRANRWLAPLGATDLDGDGFVELAYIDRPHLAKTLRIWQFRDGKLTPVAERAGLTNHRIGEDFISGGIRHCAGRPEIVTASGDWRRVMISTLESGAVLSRDIGQFHGQKSLELALLCQD
ncbi:FG-GAP repeat domain-containing protein [Shimia abyssi]|uniref:VCBS repeat protein n=1 Tax=Shimia abyssi TaxID=1662395 RepID=A0A2P8FKY3_9RHOB|nr:VCBS repeat-containing protein [Shimia abyssi]PSL22362.1 hypothetical protein CLV88_101791 [Shimia abyssi]